MKLIPSLGTFVLLGLFTTQFILPVSAIAQGMERTPSQMMNDQPADNQLPNDYLWQAPLPFAYRSIQLTGIPTEREEVIAFWQESLNLGSPDGAYNLALLYLEEEDPFYDPTQAILHFMLAERFEHQQAPAILEQIKGQITDGQWQRISAAAEAFIEQNVVLPTWTTMRANQEAPFHAERFGRAAVERGQFDYPSDLIEEGLFSDLVLIFLVDEKGNITDSWLPGGYSPETYQNVESFKKSRIYEPSPVVTLAGIEFKLTIHRGDKLQHEALSQGLNYLWSLGLAGNPHAQVAIASIVRRLVGERHRDVFEFNEDDVSAPEFPISIYEPHEIRTPLHRADIIMGRRGRASEVTLIDAEGLTEDELEQAISEIKKYRFGRGTERGQHYRIVEDDDGQSLRRVNQVSGLAYSAYWYDRAARQNIAEARMLFLTRDYPSWLYHSLQYGGEQEQLYAAIRIFLRADVEEYKAEAQQVLEHIAASGSKRYAEIASRALTQAALAAN